MKGGGGRHKKKEKVVMKMTTMKQLLPQRNAQLIERGTLWKKNVQTAAILLILMFILTDG